MSAAPPLVIQQLTIALRNQSSPLVRGLDLTINRGELVCLVGESGAGKSLSALAVMGLLPNRVSTIDGTAHVAGEDVLSCGATTLRRWRGSRMAMIFQEPLTALNPVLACGVQIEEVLVAHTTMSGAERHAKIAATLRRVRIVDVERAMRSYPHQLSGGERQRVMIAMALVLEPVLLIADEPTTALDVTTQAQILALIHDVRRERDMGVLYITHDFGVVAEIADRVAVMRGGVLVECGITRDVLTRPRHPYTRALIAAVPSLVPPARTPTPAPAPAPVLAPVCAPALAPIDTVLLRVESLVKTYGVGSWPRSDRVIRAVDDVSFQLKRGEVLGIVGESGAGKSTVARCVARLVEPTGGRIFFASQDIARFKGATLRMLRRRVQIVFQDPYRSLNPHRTVRQALIEGPMNFGVKRAAAVERAADLLGLVSIDASALDRYPHQFSGGERQRICIARALAMDPDLLIADEPVSALDASVQAQVMALLADLSARFGLTMLFVTHDLRVAAQICDTVAVMQAGRVVEFGDVTNIFRAPRETYTRALIDAAPGQRCL